MLKHKILVSTFFKRTLCPKFAVMSATPMNGEVTRIYAKRWLMLILFCLLSMTNAFQWLQYSIINNLLIQYYDVQSLAIDWTSMVYMIVYIPFIFPASWLLDKYGLRLTLIIGALLNCLGPWIKCGSINPGRFYVTFIGQTVSALAQVFILGVPPRLAAIWFGPGEVSTATSIGVFGNQVGCAVGFLIPPIIVNNISLSSAFNYSSELYTSTMTTQLYIMFFGTAGFTTVIFILIIIFFSDKPALPPSLAQLAAIQDSMDGNFGQTLKKLVTDLNYMLLLVTYGINVGVFYAVSTLLNPILVSYFPGEEENIGRIGLILVLAGMVGSVVCGVWLDRTKRYKSTICVVYALSFVGMVTYTFTIDLNYLWIVFVVAAFLGFFTTGYLPLGFEYGCELTYPLPEGTSSGLLNASAQVFGIILTTSIGYLLPISARWCNVTLSIALLIGTIITFVIKADLRRHKAELERSSQNVSNAKLQDLDFTLTDNNNLTKAYVNSCYEVGDKEDSCKNEKVDDVMKL